MRRKISYTVLFFVIGLIFSILYIYIFNVGHGGKQDTDNNEEPNLDTRISKKHKVEEPDDVSGHYKISFEKYKDIYRNWEPTELVEFEKNDVCQKKGENFGYTFVEFVFLDREKEGVLKPYDISSIKFEDLEYVRSCPGAAKRFHGTMEKHASCRIRFAVVKNCEQCPDVLVPGRRYRFYEFEGIGEVDYQFQVPEAGKLEFVKPDSNREPEVYRYPILVDDIRKTREAKRKFRKSIKLTIRNGISSLPSSEFGDFSNVLVIYETENMVEKTKGLSEDGKYKLKLNVPEARKVNGGDVKIFGVFDESSIGSDQQEKNSERVGIRMLMYKQEIEGKNVDMSEGLNYRRQPEKTVEKEMVLDLLLKKNGIEIPKTSPVEIKLKKIYWDQKKSILICRSSTYSKGGNWRTTLEARPGKYALVIGREVVDKNFQWPPKD